jgi:hypothetical protein
VLSVHVAIRTATRRRGRRSDAQAVCESLPKIAPDAGYESDATVARDAGVAGTRDATGGAGRALEPRRSAPEELTGTRSAGANAGVGGPSGMRPRDWGELSRGLRQV